MHKCASNQCAQVTARGGAYLGSSAANLCRRVVREAYMELGIFLGLFHRNTSEVASGMIAILCGLSSEKAPV
jgi:hypothetical protein